MVQESIHGEVQLKDELQSQVKAAQDRDRMGFVLCQPLDMSISFSYRKGVLGAFI